MSEYCPIRNITVCHQRVTQTFDKVRSVKKQLAQIFLPSFVNFPYKPKARVETDGACSEETAESDGEHETEWSIRKMESYTNFVMSNLVQK